MRRDPILGSQIYQRQRNWIVILIAAVSDVALWQRNTQELHPGLILPLLRADGMMQADQLAARVGIVNECLLRRFRDRRMDVNKHSRVTRKLRGHRLLSY